VPIRLVILDPAAADAADVGDAGAEMEDRAEARAPNPERSVHSKPGPGPAAAVATRGTTASQAKPPSPPAVAAEVRRPQARSTESWRRRYESASGGGKGG